MACCFKVPKNLRKYRQQKGKKSRLKRNVWKTKLDYNCDVFANNNSIVIDYNIGYLYKSPPSSHHHFFHKCQQPYYLSSIAASRHLNNLIIIINIQIRKTKFFYLSQTFIHSGTSGSPCRVALCCHMRRSLESTDND